MRIATHVALALALTSPLVLAACGDSKQDADPFDTLQDCYDDHHNVETLTVQQAIVVCCLDHPIAGVHPSCTDQQDTCVAHVRAELDASVVDADIAAACTTYLNNRD